MNRSHFYIPSLTALMVLVLSACARPFVAIDSPGIILIEPDLSAVITEPVITVRLRASSTFRSVSRVEIGSKAMSYNPSENIWEAPVSLDIGLNELIVTAFDEESVPGMDTLFAFHMPFQFQPFPARLPTPLGGHTATLMPFGALMITGGTRSAEDEASGEVHVLPGGSVNFQTLPVRMIHPRVGHTATILNDGSLLILGGAMRGGIDTTDNLVEAVEIFDENTQSFKEIPVLGPPIRRMFHTAAHRNTPNGQVIDVLGGHGDIQYTPSSILGTRRDLRSFLFRNDSLIALSPAIGPFVAPVEGHSQTPLTFLTQGEAGEYFVTGLSSAPQDSPLSFVIDYGSIFGILVDEAPVMRVPRVRHASERLSHEIIGFFGGITSGRGGLAGTSEVYLRQIDGYFVIPPVPSHSFSLRYGLTATIIAPNRIILTGGFNENGVATDRIDIFRYTL